MANPVFSLGQNVDYTNPENGHILPCYVVDCYPVADGATGTVTGYQYTISGDMNDVQWPKGNAYGPFKHIAEASLSARSGLAS